MNTHTEHGDENEIKQDTDIFDDSLLRADHVAIVELMLRVVDLRDWFLVLYLPYGLFDVPLCGSGIMRPCSHD